MNQPKIPTQKTPVKEKKIIWRMDKITYDKYLEYALELYEAEPFSSSYHEALDALKSLPGYPLEYNMNPGEVLVPDVVDTPRVVVQ